ncbi:hypothetical protein [Amycolatopsis pithecellobii]|uniref:hypothetical protein n=1 Tax=Amycolatopsis pithecellobii TaxID=664692 RepID=UPI0012B8E507|nr:hypothetical protein [Amycolatopsis pithecellobii]
MTTICTRCGAAREAEEEPALALAWVSERDRGGVRWLCLRCAREHTRDIEGRLPAEYW